MTVRSAGCIATVVFVAGCGGDDDRTDATCDVGALDRSAIHSGAIVLACGEAPDGRRVRISAGFDDAGACLEISGLPGGTRACGRAPSGRVPRRKRAIQGPVVVRRPRSERLELYGEATSAVRRVVVRFVRPSGESGRRTASLIRIEDRDALRAAEIGGPFGYFIGFVPRRARQLVATAYDRDGSTIGRLRYDPVVESLHPTVFIARPTRLGE